MSEAFYPYVRKTRRALYLSSVFHEPFSSLFPLLPFILLKDLGATAFQIVLLTMLKPLAAIFSFYWSERLSQNRHTLRWNILIAGILGRILFLPALFFNQVWLLILASTIYMIFSRASIPAWMEVLRRNLPKTVQGKFFSTSSAIGYGEGIVIAIAVGSLLDTHLYFWKLLFLAGTLFSILGVVIQALLPVRELRQGMIKEKQERALSWRDELINPWKDCIRLMRERSDFRQFQWAFMIAGFGLMVIQPVIPIFFDEVLRISYRDLMVAYSVCKGLGFVASSPLWRRGLAKITVTRFTTIVLWSFSLFPICLILSLRGDLWFYLAYLAYGIAQSGSHLIWHLSGPIFSKEGQSSRFSSVNILLVGVRGLLGPPLGGLLVLLGGPLSVFSLSIGLFSMGGAMLLRKPTEVSLSKES